MRRHRFIFTITITVTLVLGALLLARGRGDATDNPDDQWALVQNHFYIERIPKDARDMVHQLVFLDHEDAGKVGARMHGSRFRLFLDSIAWSRRGNEVAIKTLQTDKVTKGTFRAWTCAGNAPKPFELCLELREGDRTRTYYSRKDWIIDSVPDAQALAAALPDAP